MANYYVINNFHVVDQELRYRLLFPWNIYVAGKYNLHAAALLVTVQWTINSTCISLRYPLI